MLQELKVFGMKLEGSKTEIMKIGYADHLDDIVKLDILTEPIICVKEMKYLG